MLVRILMSLVVVLVATDLAPLLYDQVPSKPEKDIYNGLPCVMAPEKDDVPSAGRAPLICASTDPAGRLSPDRKGPRRPFVGPSAELDGGGYIKDIWHPDVN